jgi:hypothetical protein
MLRDAIAQNVDLMVDDPGSEEMSRRVMWQMDNKRKAEAVEVIGPSVRGHERLIGLMFPRFGSSRSGEVGTRISRRRNLIRALYLGDAPGLVSIVEVNKIWSESDETVLYEKLLQRLEDNELRPLIDRLGDVLPNLVESGDEKFWRALAKTLIRDRDWLLAPEDNRAIAEDAATHLVNFGERTKSNAERVKRVANALCDAEDLVIFPRILLYHLRKWGLTGNSHAETSGKYSFTKTETIDLLEKSVPYFKSALLGGIILRRIPSWEVMLILAFTNNWDSDLRQSLTTQLEVHEARATIAGLLVPPNFLVARAFLDKLFATDIVLAWMKVANEGLRSDSWSALCLKRLRAVLSGRDSIFAVDDDVNDDEDLPRVSPLNHPQQ